jgi:hypothetical protein
MAELRRFGAVYIINATLAVPCAAHLSHIWQRFSYGIDGVSNHSEYVWFYTGCVADRASDEVIFSVIGWWI